MADIKELMVDHKKANKGILVDYIKDVKLLIAKKPNPAFGDYMHELIQPHLASISAGTFDEKLDKLLTKKAVAQTILLGWENLTEGGKPIEYSPEKAFELLNNPNLEDLYRFVLSISHSIELYRVQEEKESEKNSENS